MDRLPEALVSRFAIATRDVLWFKDRVLRVFERASVPSAVMADLRRRKHEPTIKLAQSVVDMLEKQVDGGGEATLQRLFTEIAEWTDFNHLDADKRLQARASQNELKKAIREYADQRKFLKKREREHQREREARVEVSQLDHQKLQEFRDEFDRAHGLGVQARGNALEKLLNEIFDYYCPRNRGPFRRLGEQVDGNFYFDNHHYFSEIRWRAEKATAADVAVLRDRASAAFGGDVKALFISFNGFTDECLKALGSRAAAERVILMDGLDLRSVLNADIAFEVLLDEKQAYAVREQRPFVSAREIILARLESGRP